MRKLTSALLLIMSITVLCQENNHNFSLNNKDELVWTYCYKSSLTKKDLWSEMKLSGDFTDMDSVGGYIIAHTKPIHLFYEKMAYPKFNVTIQAKQYDYSQFVKIEVKNGSYRVNVSDICLYDYKLRTQYQTATKTFVLNNMKYRSGFTNHTSKIMNYTYTDLFDFN